MSDIQTKSSGGVTLLGLTFIVFLTLKLCGVITWSWWWVTAPLWGGFAILAAMGIIGAAIFLAGYIIYRLKR